MSFKRKIYKFKNAIEIEEYHTGRYGAPGMSRIGKRKATPEEMAKVNQWRREKNCRHKLRTYFDVNDYYVTLTYQADLRPADMAEAKKHFAALIRKLQRRYKKAGYELRYIRNIEVGTRNGWHVHLVINRIPGLDVMISECWPYGYPDIKMLRKFREFAELAAYLVKTPKTDSRLREANYSSSRNMPLPDPVQKIYLRWKTWKKPKIKEGWELDRDSYVEGLNPVTGFPYRHYTLLRSRRC